MVDSIRCMEETSRLSLLLITSMDAPKGVNHAMPPSTQLLTQIPRHQLEKLLHEDGRHQTVEEFLNQPEIHLAVKISDLYGKRAKAAAWSRLWLLASTLLSAASFLSSPNPEDFVAMILLGGMSVLEFKVHSWFLQNDTRGPFWGYRNQCLFALLFLAYGIYHFLNPTPHQELAKLGMHNLDGAVESLEKIVYAVIGIGGATGQYMLALYYRKAAKFSA